MTGGDGGRRRGASRGFVTVILGRSLFLVILLIKLY